MKPIKTYYDGYAFRARVEARYAVMTKPLRLRYEFELQGFSLEAGAYLPDFWFPDLDAWVEVKGVAATPRDLDLCRCLSRETGSSVALVVGTPGWDVLASVFTVGEPQIVTPLSTFLMQRGEFTADELDHAFTAARSARFEHGERPLPTPIAASLALAI